MKTVHALFDGGQITAAVMVDYFGDNIGNDENMNTILGVYKGLSLKGITPEFLHKCFMANRLDELIHKKYTHQKSGYYKRFTDNNIVIGNTCLLPVPQEDFEIMDDNHCPSCNHVNYFTENYIQGAPPDCSRCLKTLCEMCKSHYDKAEFSYVCKMCTTAK